MVRTVILQQEDLVVLEAAVLHQQAVVRVYRVKEIMVEVTAVQVVEAVVVPAAQVQVLQVILGAAVLAEMV